MKNRYLWLTVGLALSTLIVAWFPFLLKVHTIAGVAFDHAGMERIVQNFDGLNFLTVAKTWYNPTLISQDFQEILNNRRPLYFAAHYPGFPALISVFDHAGFTGPQALLAAIITSNVILAVSLYYFFLAFTKDDKRFAFILASIALIIPGRMLGDRIVGSNEPLFTALVLGSLTASLKNKHWLASLMGVGAFLTRSPGILLFPAYLLYFGYTMLPNWKKAISTTLPYVLIPLTLIGLFLFYGYTFHSFWAYFQVGGNINLYYPFAVFSSGQDWVSGMWLEDIIYLFGILALAFGILYERIYSKKLPLTAAHVFGAIYLLFLMSVAHRDLARYSLPIWPIALTAFAPFLAKRYVQVILILLFFPILLYTWQFVLANYQPVSNWQPFL